MGSQDTHPKGAVCVLGPLSAWKTENDGHSSLSRISCPQTLTPSGESWSNRDQAPRTPLLPSNPVDHAWKRKRRTKLNDAGSNAGNYGKISWRLVKCFQIECSRIIKILRAFIRRDRLLQKSSRRKGAIKRYDRNVNEISIAFDHSLAVITNCFYAFLEFAKFFHSFGKKNVSRANKFNGWNKMDSRWCSTRTKQAKA